MSVANGATSQHGAAPLERTLALLDPTRCPERLEIRAGYLDLLRQEDPTGPHPGQRLMVSRALPLIYERLWRPVGGALLMGPFGPGRTGEHRIALRMLSISPGDRVLDVGCGTGEFTRAFSLPAGQGLVVGLDASATMLRRAASLTRSGNVAYTRGDAAELPFADESFDAVCCFAALYLIERPMRAIDEILRVLGPGGRLGLLASCHRGPVGVELTRPAVKGLTGVRMFDRHELTGALRARGLVDVRQRVSGLAQFVGARKAGGATAGIKAEA